MSELLILETALVVIAAIIASVMPRVAAAGFKRLEITLGRLARRKTLATLGITIVALAAGGLPRLAEGIPRPQKHDEFSYLLAADTFAHLRITNPTHPLWEHFESFQIIQRPTYMSMYPPAQGVVLAAGKILAGRAWFGVWLSVAIMCGALCWALQQWLPPGWALFGAFIAVTRLATYGYWIESYWGGAVAATGGALMLGALPRLLRYGSRRDSLLLGLGVGIVANSRPFEGLALTIPVAAAVAVWIWKHDSLRRAKALVPAAILLSLTCAGILYYNWRITTDPLLMPHAANRVQYAVGKLFVFQKVSAVPEYRHKVFRDFYLGWDLAGFRLSTGWAGFEACFYEKAGKIWLFFFGPVFTIALFPIWRVVRDRRIRPLLIFAAVAAPILSVSVAFSPHYVAPYIVIIYALLLQGLRHVRAWRFRDRPIGIGLVRALPLICVIMIAFRAAALPLHLSLLMDPAAWCSQFTPDYLREQVVGRLKDAGGRHLVIVRYSADHVPHQEWVYNDADIDASPVVWAREMDKPHNEALIRYFHDRQIWLLQPDRDLLKLSAYPR